MFKAVWSNQDELCLVTAVSLHGYDWHLVTDALNEVFSKIYGPNVNVLSDHQCGTFYMCLEKKYEKLFPIWSPSCHQKLNEVLRNELIQKHLCQIEVDLLEFCEKYQANSAQTTTGFPNFLQQQSNDLKDTFLAIKSGKLNSKFVMIYRAAATSKEKMPFFEFIWSTPRETAQFFDSAFTGVCKAYLMNPIRVEENCGQGTSMKSTTQDLTQCFSEEGEPHVTANSSGLLQNGTAFSDMAQQAIQSNTSDTQTSKAQFLQNIPLQYLQDPEVRTLPNAFIAVEQDVTNRRNVAQKVNQRKPPKHYSIPVKQNQDKHSYTNLEDTISVTLYPTTDQPIQQSFPSAPLSLTLSQIETLLLVQKQMASTSKRASELEAALERLDDLMLLESQTPTNNTLYANRSSVSSLISLTRNDTLISPPNSIGLTSTLNLNLKRNALGLVKNLKPTELALLDHQPPFPTPSPSLSPPLPLASSSSVAHQNPPLPTFPPIYRSVSATDATVRKEETSAGTRQSMLPTTAKMHHLLKNPDLTILRHESNANHHACQSVENPITFLGKLNTAVVTTPNPIPNPSQNPHPTPSSSTVPCSFPSPFSSYSSLSSSTSTSTSTSTTSYSSSSSSTFTPSSSMSSHLYSLNLLSTYTPLKRASLSRASHVAATGKMDEPKIPKSAKRAKKMAPKKILL